MIQINLGVIMKIIITTLLSIFILGACSKSPSIEEVVEICSAKAISDMPENERTEENKKFMKNIMLGMLEKEKQEGKLDLEKVLSECTKNQNGEIAENVSSLDELVEKSKELNDLLGVGDEIMNENTENIEDIIDALGD